MTSTPSTLANGFTQQLVQCRDTAIVGGKAANLGRLVRAGFMVPDGFVVTTGAYLYAVGAAPPSGSNGSSNGSNGANGAHDDEDGTKSDLPSDLAEQILTAYAAIGGGPVAVRSSATAEDMAA